MKKHRQERVVGSHVVATPHRIRDDALSIFYKRYRAYAAMSLVLVRVFSCSD